MLQTALAIYYGETSLPDQSYGKASRHDEKLRKGLRRSGFVPHAKPERPN